MRDANDFRDEVYRRAAKQRKRERRQLSAVVGCVALLLVTGIGGSTLLSLTAKSDDAEVNKHNMEFTEDSIYEGATDTAKPTMSTIDSAQQFPLTDNDICLPCVYAFDSYDGALADFMRKSGKTEADFNAQGFTEEFFTSNDAIFIIVGQKMSEFSVEFDNDAEKISVSLTADFVEGNGQKQLVCIPSERLNGRPVSLLINGIKMGADYNN